MTPEKSLASNKIATRLKQIFLEHKTFHEPSNPDNLWVEFDSDWPSLCYLSQGSLEQGKHYPWQPIKQEHQDMFERLSDALEIKVHPDLISYFSSYWSNHIPATSKDGDLELLQVWNQDDMERLRSNLLGHALDKKKRKHELSFFFAVTTSEDGMLCINNDSGEIWYEIPGKKPKRKIADSLYDFLLSLTPK